MQSRHGGPEPAQAAAVEAVVKVAATAKAAKLAEELGVELDAIEGTGKDGRITVKDVRRFVPSVPRRRPAEEVLTALEERARVVDVFGAFGARTLIEVPTELAMELFQEPLSRCGGLNVVEAVERDLAEIGDRAAWVSDSAIAATAVRLAYELQNPFNSATSKSMCARSMIEAMNRLRELAPKQEEPDQVDELATARATRLAGGAKA